MLFGVDWFGFRPEKLAELLENGEGSAPLRETAAQFRELRDTFETLASEMDSLLAQLMSAWGGVAAESAAAAFREFSIGAREIATVSETVSQQADAQADANDAARSAMPTLQEILEVLAAIAAARASQNYGLVAALMAVYRILSARASSTMQGYETATVPNVQQPPPQQASPIANPGAGVSDPSGLFNSFNDQLGQSAFASPEPMDLQSSSSTLAELNGGGFGGGAFGGIAGPISMVAMGAIASAATGFPRLGALAAPPAFGSPGGVPAAAMAPGAGGAPGVFGPPRSQRDQKKERRPQEIPGTVVARDDLDEEVPEIPGVVIGESDEIYEVAVSDERLA